MNEIIIRVYESVDEPGYLYDIYDTADVTDDREPIEAGHCTTTIENALEMAYMDARKIMAKGK
jgi:hypothetical protein